MIELTHRATGHKVRSDEASVDFWKSAGYAEAAKPAVKKAPAKKSASSKSEK